MTNQKNCDVLGTLYLRKVTEGDLTKIDALLSEYYSYEVPDRVIFRLTREDVGNLDYERVRRRIKGNCSFGVFVKATEELVALYVNTIHDKHSTDNPPTDGEISTDNERVATLLRFSHFMEGDIFKDLNSSKFMMISMACCKAQYRNIRLSTKLLEVGVSFAQSMGCDYVVAEAVSRYSQRAMLSAGFKVFREMKYSDYVDPLTGKKPDLKLSAIHTSSMLMFRELLSPDGGELD